MENIERCPFCGGEALLCKERGLVNHYSIACSSCNIDVTLHYDPMYNMPDESTRIKNIVNSWNRRVNEKML